MPMQRNRWFGYQINQHHLLQVLTCSRSQSVTHQAPSMKCGGKSKQLEVAAILFTPHWLAEVTCFYQK